MIACLENAIVTLLQPNSLWDKLGGGKQHLACGMPSPGPSWGWWKCLCDWVFGLLGFLGDCRRFISSGSQGLCVAHVWLTAVNLLDFSSGWTQRHSPLSPRKAVSAWLQGACALKVSTLAWRNVFLWFEILRASKVKQLHLTLKMVQCCEVFKIKPAPGNS